MKNLTADDLNLLARSITMCFLAIILCGALCLTLFYKSYADPTVLVAIIASTNFILGYLAGKRTQNDSSTQAAVNSKPESI